MHGHDAPVLSAPVLRVRIANAQVPPQIRYLLYLIRVMSSVVALVQSCRHRCPVPPGAGPAPAAHAMSLYDFVWCGMLCPEKWRSSYGLVWCDFACPGAARPVIMVRDSMETLSPATVTNQR